MDRRTELLQAAYDLLKNSQAAQHTIVHYDEADCDGVCLMEDIRIELEAPTAVTMTHLQYNELSEDKMFLECLRAAGVDNWPGYGDAWDMMEGDEEEF